MDFLLYGYYAVAFVLTVGVLIAFHEAGHFVIARAAGAHVARFSIGFGKVLWSRTDRRGTQFCVAALPLGGYVRMWDEREPGAQLLAPAVAGPVSYHRVPPLKRIAIALGGPCANFVLAFLVYYAVAVAGVSSVIPVIGAVAEDTPAYRAGLRGGEEIVAVDGAPTRSWQDVGLALAARIGDSGSIALAVRAAGQGDDAGARRHAIAIENWNANTTDPDLTGSLGIAAALRPVVGRVQPDSPASRAGLKAGDLLSAVDGDRIGTWSELVERLQSSPGETLLVSVQSAGGSRTVRMTPAPAIAPDGSEIGRIGVEVHVPTRLLRAGPLDAIAEAGRQTWSVTALSLQLLGKMVTLSVAPTNVAGPLTIAQVAGDSAQIGIAAYATLLALLSVSLGIINLLPIPILDGGLVVVTAVEMLRRRPLSARAEAMLARTGLVLVGGIMLLAFYSDFARLLPGLGL